MTSVGKIYVWLGPESIRHGTGAANKEKLEKAMFFTAGPEEKTAMSSFISGVWIIEALIYKHGHELLLLHLSLTKTYESLLPKHYVLQNA